MKYIKNKKNESIKEPPKEEFIYKNHKKFKVVKKDESDNPEDIENQRKEKPFGRLKLFKKDIAKAKKPNIKYNFIFNDNKLKNRLLVATIVLLMLVSIFTFIFQFIRVNNIDKLIENTNKNIVTLEDIEANIGVANEEYLYDKLFNQKIYDSGSITLFLSDFWHYSIIIHVADNEGVELSATELTADNFDTICNVPEGDTITVEIREIMDKNILPLIVSIKGNICSGDAGDDITSYFYNTSLDNTYNKSSNTNVESGVKYNTVTNSLKYTFIKGENNVAFNVSTIFSDRLNSQLPDNQTEEFEFDYNQLVIS